jgi:hypothetical protein
VLAAGLAPAQDGPPAARTQSQPAANPDSQDQDSQDLKAQDQDSPDLANAGPSVFSRDSGLLAQRGGKLIDLRLYGEITGVYDSALAPAPAVQNGPAKALPDYGVEYGLGLIGSRRWRHARLSIEYKGMFREYAKDSLLNGSDQFLDLAYNQLLRPHLTLDLKEIAGTTTVANGEFSYLPLTNTDSFALPANELFDSRTNYDESRVDLLWQKTARLSFDFGAEGFVVRRQYPGLAGLNGYSARAGVAYRLTRRQTVGLTYQHTYFDFQNLFGNAQLQTAAIAYSVSLSRTVDLQMQVGGTRLNSSGLTEVSLDPAIAAIVGQNIAVVTFSRVLYVPLADARLVERFRHASLILGFSSGISPGNGVYLTSRQTAATGGLSYTGAHKFTAALNASYNRLATLGQTLPLYTNLQGGGGLTYRLSGDTYIELRYDYRHYSTQNLLYKMDSNRISLGVAFSPGSSPLAIW